MERGLDGERPALRHRVPGIHDQVDDHLLDLARIGHDLPRVVARDDHDLDVLADEAPQDGGHAGHQRLEIDGLRLEDLLAAEREQLPGEIGGPLRGGLDQVDVLARGVVGPHPHEEQAAPPADHGQQVVEVVRDPSRELADRLDLLGLGELGLRLLQLRVRRLEFLDEPGLPERDRELGRHLPRDADLLLGEVRLVPAEANRSDELAGGNHRDDHVHGDAGREQRVRLGARRQHPDVDGLRLPPAKGVQVAREA